MKYLISIIFFILLLSSCLKNEGVRIEDDYFYREDSVLLCCLDTILSPDTTIRKYILPYDNYYPDLDIEESIRFWDTARIYIAFYDTLYKFPWGITYKEFSNFSQHKRFYDIESLDTNFFALFDKIVKDSIKVSERRTDIYKFNSRYNYRIIPDDSIEIIRDKGYYIIKKYIFSRVVLNDTYNYACFIDAVSSSPTAGGVELVLLKKYGKQWIVVKRIVLAAA